MASTIWRDCAAIHACQDPVERSRLAWDAIVRNPGLVRHLARRVYGFADEDTVSSCQIALHTALLYTDPSKGGPFRVGMWFAVRELEGRHGIHVPRNVVAAYRAWVGRGNDPRHLETTTHLSDEERVRIVWLLSRKVNEVDLDGIEPHVLEHSDPRDLDQEIDTQQIHELLSGMSARNRESLLCPFTDDESLQDVGDRHGVSRERIRQIHVRLFQKLQQLFLPEADDG